MRLLFSASHSKIKKKTKKLIFSIKIEVNFRQNPKKLLIQWRSSAKNIARLT